MFNRIIKSNYESLLLRLILLKSCFKIQCCFFFLLVPWPRDFSLLCSDKDFILYLEMRKLCLFAFVFLIQPEVYFIYDTSEGTNFIFFHMDNQLFQHFQNIIHSFPQWFVKISLSYIKFLYMLGVFVLHCCCCVCVCVCVCV